MTSTRVDADFKRRASLAVIWQDLVTPVRAILGFQEIIVEQGQRLRLEGELPYLHRVLAAAGALNDIVDRILDSSPDAGADADDPRACTRRWRSAPARRGTRRVALFASVRRKARAPGKL